MKTFFTLVSTILLSCNICFSQWRQTDGPYGPINVLGIIEHDKLLLAFTNSGYFSKNHLADKWELNSTQSFSTFAKKGDSLFVVSSYYGFKIINLKKLNTPPVNLNAIQAQALAASDSLLFLASNSQGFLISNNNGNSWDSKNNGLPTDTGRPPYGGIYISTSVRTIEVAKNYIYCGTPKGVYRNTRSFSKWISINSGLPADRPINLIKEFNDTLYTVIAERLYRSSDSGSNWSLSFTAPSTITTLVSNKNGIYIGTIKDGIYYSTDNCVNWNSLNVGLADLCINALLNYDTTLICGTNNGVFYLKNFEWINNQSGMICSSIRTMDTSNDNIITNINDSIYISNNGETWHSISTPAMPKYPNLTSYIGSILTIGDTIFISYKYTTPNFPFDHSYIKYTNDSGRNWYDLKSKCPYDGDDALRIYNEKSRLYAFEDDRMYYTDNLGLTWVNVSLPHQYCNNFYGFAIYNSIPFASACGNSELLMLSNSPSWILSNKGLPTSTEVNSLACNDDALFVYLSNHEMYVSDKTGNNWVNTNSKLDSISFIRSFVNKGNLLFIATDKGVFATNDFGLNWVSINDGLKNLSTNAIILMKDTLYVGTSGSGIWKRNINDIEFKKSNNSPLDKSIQIYPNPTSDYINVGNINNNTSYNIMDMAGKEILSGQVDSTSKIYLSDLKSGVYILMIRSEDKIKRTKLIIDR